MNAAQAESKSTTMLVNFVLKGTKKWELPPKAVAVEHTLLILPRPTPPPNSTACTSTLFQQAFTKAKWFNTVVKSKTQVSYSLKFATARTRITRKKERKKNHLE